MDEWIDMSMDDIRGFEKKLEMLTNADLSVCTDERGLLLKLKLNLKLKVLKLMVKGCFS